MNRGTTSFHLRVMETIPETEWITSVRKLTEFHAIDDGNFGQISMTVSRSLKHHLQAFVVVRINRECHVHVRCPEGILPFARGVVAHVVQNGRPGGHAFAEFIWEAVQRSLGQIKGLKTLKAESYGQPTRQRRPPPVIRRSYVWNQASQHFTALRCIVDTTYEILSFVRRGTRAQNGRLDIAHFEAGNVGCRYGRRNLCFHGVIWR